MQNLVRKSSILYKNISAHKADFIIIHWVYKLLKHSGQEKERDREREMIGC